MNLQEQKERLDLLGVYQKQQESMRERLQGTDIGKTLYHSPENIAESKIRVMDDLIDLAGETPALTSMKEELFAQWNALVDGEHPELLGKLSTPVELFTARIEVAEQAIGALQKETDLSLPDDVLADLGKGEEAAL